MGNKKEAFDKGWAVIRKTGNRRTDPRRLSWWFLGFMPLVPKKSKNRILNQMTAKLECDEKTCEEEFGLSVFSHGFGFLLVLSKAEFTLDGAHCIVGCFLWVHLLWVLLLPRCLH
jgi:hypothetical protein